ncbi:MAG TPA: DEAD/DEAH box helicase [Polyangiaceae bacterium]|nr:DEAD/DEAH box helicase [Polyangiaceae bacterium]
MTRALAALQDRFLTLSAGFSVQDWMLLGALASERALPLSVIEQLSPAPAMAAAPWLKRAELAGLVVSAPLPRGGSLKPHFSVHPDFEQLVLRKLAHTGELNALGAALRQLLSVRSVSDLTLALQAGKLADFQRRYAARKRAPESGPSTRAEWLRRSLCEPFDPDWLTRVWGADSEQVASLVLAECLIAPIACDELHAWVEQRSTAPEADPETCGVLFQHAILRGKLERVPRLLPLVSTDARPAFAAAVRFAEGDLASAQGQLDQLLAARRKQSALPSLGGVAPLLALLFCARDSDDGRTAAKRLLNADDGELGRSAQRALRTLLKHLSEAPEEQRRLDVHQLSRDASAWEVLILAFTVHLHASDPWARANWCQDVLRRAQDWQSAGYEFLARQGYFLAEMLNGEHFVRELRRLSPKLALDRSPRELVLWDLISTKPEWQKALAKLAQISEAKPQARAHAYRVAWYVDMVRGELTRPALQECRPDEGWSEGRRASLAELHALYAELPPEDQRVLDCTREQHNGQRDFTPEAPEALIGHPRVVNAVRARAPVEVMRGTPRIETREERGYVQVFVEPREAVLGVNVVPESETTLLVYRVPEAIFRASEALRGGTRVPKSHERELLSVLGKLAESVEVRSPELGSERTVEADSTPCLRFALHAGAWLVQLGVRPFSEQGRFFLAGVGRANLSVYSDGRRLRCERDLQLERDKNLALRKACPTLESPPDLDEQSPFDAPDSWTLGEEGVLQLLRELRDAALPCALEWPESGAMKLVAEVSSKTLHGRLRSDKGWYLVSGGVPVDSVTEIKLSELVRAPALGNGRFVRLASGAYVEIEARIRRVLAALRAVNSSPRPGAELRLPHSALYALAELNAADSGFQLDVESQSWLERVDRVSRQEFPLPSGLRATLRPYQVEGYRWLSALLELGLGACLADDMGLGKTIQILALILARLDETRGPTLVVAPTSVCSNWLAEIGRFAPSLRAIDYAGKERATRLAALSEDGSSECVVVCSYTLLQQDQAELSAWKWGMVVLDEAQFIKNPLSLRAKAAYSLAATHRIAATGTPVENHLGDVWGIFRFLNPGLLGDWQHFKRTFLMPVERDAGRESTELLHRLLRPFLLRRLKRDVLSDLPPLTEVQHDVQLSEDESLRYALLRKQIHDKLYTVHGKRNHKLEVLAEIMRLRRFCCHPALVFPDAPRECSKLDAFLDLVEELRENQHRALVFSQFVDFLGLVREQLDERRIRYEYLDGSTPQAERQARVAAFQNGDAPLFLVSLKAGGFGLNLTAADYVIHLDPWWNPAVEAQATDRAHRIGQERPVTVYRLVTRDSIEQKIVEMHASKRELAGALLDDSDSIAGIGTDELLELLTQSLAQPA